MTELRRRRVALPRRRLVVIRDFDAVRIPGLPMEADSKLIVDPDAVLPCPIATEPLKAVSGRNRKLADIANAVNLRELPPRHGPQRGWAGRSSCSRRGAIEDVLRSTVREGRYHGSYYNDERIGTREGPS